MSTNFATALRCRECNREYALEAIYVCEFCFGPLEVVYDYEAMRKSVTREKIESGPASIWRYADLLPCDADAAVNIEAGFTPLVKAERLGEELGLRHLYLKNDCVNPTWSFKDRVVTVAATKAREFGFDTLACASTGNLANSVSAHAAHAGLDAFVFIPSDLERGKIVGSSVYGATLIAVDGNYDEVNRLCSELVGKYPWAFVNVNMRPYYAEGSKTLAYEVAEQLGWRAPDHCVVPMASGSLYVKVWKGLQELATLWLIDSGQISNTIAKTIFDEMVRSGGEPERIMTQQGLRQVTDETAILTAVDEVLRAHADRVDQYRAGKDKLFGFFVGQVMKATQGKANPQKVNSLLKKRLSA